MAGARSSPRTVSVLTLLISVLSTFSLFSQTYPFRHYSTADGLIQASVKKIFQDSRGFLWFGTYGGLSSYDGFEFKHFLHAGDQRSIIYEIWEEENGTLWVTTHGNGIAKRSPTDTAFTWLRAADGILPNDFVPAILKDSRGHLWIGTFNGLLLLKSDGTHKVYGLESGIPHPVIRALAEDHEGALWIGTDGGLVRCVVTPDYKLIARKIIDPATLALIVLRNGDLLAGTFGQGDIQRGFIFRYRHGRGDTLISYRSNNEVVKGLSFCEDAGGTVWIGTSYGLHMFREGRLTRLRMENGLHNEYIYDIHEDREGTMWFSTEDGVMKLRNPRFVNYGREQGLGSSIVTAMVEDRGKNIWLGTFNGLARLSPDGNFRVYGEHNGLPHRVISSIVEDEEGTVWVGTPRGLATFSRMGLGRPAVRGLPEKIGITSLCTGPDGAIWAGGRGVLLKIEHGTTSMALHQSDGLPNAMITSLMSDRAGNLWFGSGQGAGFVADGSVRLYSKNDGLPDLDVEGFFLDGRGTLWIATARGVVMRDGTKLVRGLLPAGMPEDVRVFFVLEDGSGHYWFGTENGVYAREDFFSYQFDSHDGLAGDMVEYGLLDSRGNLWFGTHNGVSTLGKSDRLLPSASPTVLVEEITVGEKDRPLRTESEIPYEDRTVVFRFSALSFLDEKNIRFQWMLEGFDKEWLPPQHQRQVRYTNLNPGRYSFFARAANRNGPWSESVRSDFAILLPFWQTWWFILLSSLTVFTLAALAYRYRVNQLLKIERMRTRIATDLHDDIGASLSRIALYSEVAKEESQKTSPRLYEVSEKIGETAREMLDAVGTLVWSIDPRHDKFEDVMTQMKNFAQEMLRMRNIDCTFNVSPEAAGVTLPVEARKNLLLIFKEAVNNIVKHAECKTVEVRVSQKRGALELRISDDGKGISSSSKTDGHGLANMQARTHAVKGELFIQSNDGRGTTILLRVPPQRT